MSVETIKQGWLHTREGEKFAPQTLVENVTTRSGKPYDERVREYLGSLNSSLTRKIESVKGEISGKNYDKAIKNLQDKDVELNNAISSVNGLVSSNSVAIANLQIKDSGHDTDIANLQNKTNQLSNQLQYFDGLTNDRLLIIDNNNNVVAYVDGTGVHSIDFLIGVDNKSIAEQLQWFDGSSGSEFFFIDNSNNVVAFIDGNGIHSTEYIHKNGTTFSQVLEKIEAFDNELKWFAPDENNEAFYIIDNSDNVAAKIDGSGIDAVDFRAKGQDYSLVGLNSVVKTNADGIGQNKQAIESNDADILTLQSRATALEERAGSLEDRTVAVEQLASANQNAHGVMEDNLEEYYGYNNFGDDTFYFIDKSKNVGTMVNGAGITTTNITFANEKNAKDNIMFFEKRGTINITF